MNLVRGELRLRRDSLGDGDAVARLARLDNMAASTLGIWGTSAKRRSLTHYA